MIKAVLLDLGEVVVGLDFPRAYRAAAKLTDHTVEEIPAVISASGLASVYEHGRISSETFYEKLSAALGLSVDFSEFRGIWENMFDPEPLISDSFLEGLARQTTLLLVSNTNELHFNSVRQRYPLLQHFHDSILSYKVGSMKPEEGIYQEAIRIAGCRPGECFFTDDKVVNVDAALELGIDATVFRDEATLQGELRERGVEWN